uniref:Uncharacterized protein n=1 Tax=Megaselia scalaris TaxID=36166 RepID=T1GIG6_MEGSC
MSSTDERSVNAIQNLVSDKINAFARFLNSLAAIKRSYGTIQINKSINVGGAVSSSSSSSGSSSSSSSEAAVQVLHRQVNTSFNNGNSIGSGSSSTSSGATSTSAAVAATANVEDNEIRNDGNVTPRRYYRKVPVNQYYYIPRHQ